MNPEIMSGRLVVTGTRIPLAVLRAGGDFADGAIAWEGRWLGGETFVSFDRKAVARMKELGEAATALG